MSLPLIWFLLESLGACTFRLTNITLGIFSVMILFIDSFKQINTNKSEEQDKQEKTD